MGRKVCRPMSAGPPALSREVPGLRAQSVSYRKGDCMTSQGMQERTGRHMPSSFQSLFVPLILFPGLPKAASNLCRGPNFSPKNISGGPKNVTKFFRNRRKSEQTQNRGRKKTFSGRTKFKVTRNMELLHLRPEDSVLGRDVASQCMSNFHCEGQ